MRSGTSEPALPIHHLSVAMWRHRLAYHACLASAAVLLASALLPPILDSFGVATTAFDPGWSAFAGVVGLASLLAASHLGRNDDSRPARIVWAAALALLVARPFAATYDQDHGFTRLIRFGERFEAEALPALQNTPHFVHRTGPGHPLHTGYDGQFYAQVALDPLLLQSRQMSRGFDEAGYRTQRILHPALANLLGLGRPNLVLRAYVLLGVAWWLALLGWLLFSVQLRPFGARAGLVVTAICLSFGVTESMARCLPDVAAATLILFALQGSAGLGAWAVAAAALARNTGVLGAAGLLTTSLDPTSLRRNLKVGLVAVVPLVAWLGYVVYRFGTERLAGNDNLDWPVVALADRLARAIAEMSAVDFSWRNVPHLLAVDHRARELLAVAAAVVQVVFVLAHARRWRGSRWPAPLVRVGIAFCVLALCLGGNVWYATEAAMRALIPLNIAFNLLLLRSPAAVFIPLFTLGNATLIHSVFSLYSVGGPW